MVKCDWLIVM